MYAVDTVSSALGNASKEVTPAGKGKTAATRPSKKQGSHTLGSSS